MDEHVLQVESNYCVPACIVMLEIWRGRAPVDPDARQRELFNRYQFNGGCALPNLHPEHGEWLPWFNINDPDVVSRFALELSPDRRVLVDVVSMVYARALRARGIESPHGQLPSHPGPLHALCVIGRVDRTLHVLDPWVSRNHQPIELRFSEFVACWTGNALLCERD